MGAFLKKLKISDYKIEIDYKGFGSYQRIGTVRQLDMIKIYQSYIKDDSLVESDKDYYKSRIIRLRESINAPINTIKVTHKSTRAYVKCISLKTLDRDLLFSKIARARQARMYGGRETRKRHAGLSYSLTGLVHKKPGDFMVSRIYSVWDSKSPTEKKNHYVGIEVEFVAKGYDENDIGEELQAAGLGKYCYVFDEHCGIEICILAKESEYKDVLARVLDVIEDFEGYAGDNCGIHVHLDMRSRDVNKCYHNLYKSLGLMKKLVTKDRHGGQWSSTNAYSDFTSQKDYQDFEDNRYLAINTLSYDRHETLEIRLHHGSVD